MRGEPPCRHVISPAPILTQYLSVYFSLSAEVRPNAFPTEGPSDMESAVSENCTMRSISFRKHRRGRVGRSGSLTIVASEWPHS